ncbi:maleylpyruvate isomerase family mycothiol-dependent enzyme [Mycobacterium sp. IDR2000157661]|uniref:maleylpyruvate isomerase family mycothiol-dependent enzyme n=1 Tax=Mycobacterium sp. IDR2000157661 TaxID=2867005 RepID=UPI001EEC7468|nr:maleylpyruvate isomerase family mycothiol-dependent enzyme [Mycobacterium sp. IDR2000157661]ULE34356.1 maleylpyruvate isomerase family mycothiol-dependent enzyme [Mycobacterium sp. IDR2000157661]
MDFRAALLDQTRAFGDLIRNADPSTPVPTCPDWTLKQLFTHVGRGNRWAAQIVAERRYQPLDPREVRDGKPPDDPDGAADWLNAGAEALVKAVDRVGPDCRVWTFLGSKPAGWWIRRRLHEVTVHHADATLALGVDYDLPAELAADAVSEWIELMTVQAKRSSPPVERGRRLHMHATDEGLGPSGEWTVVNDEDGLWWSHEHGKGDVALRGRARDLLLVLVRRRRAADGDVEVLGDSAVWEGWLERTPF